ncbi:MAG: deoxyribodipyrimidine photo-lyase, partial [Chthoniobacteraceae bacterium]
MTTAIHWFRRDLRLSDNTALNAALAAHDSVVPVYVVSDWKRRHHWCGAPRQEFLCGCLASLHRNLEAKGGRLVIRSGPADVALEKLVRETGASAIFFNRDPDPFGREMERRVETMA